MLRLGRRRLGRGRDAEAERARNSERARAKQRAHAHARPSALVHRALQIARRKKTVTLKNI